jgi:MinD-like ATPase involved in chromosome partitioning or flagellar assembly
VAAVNSVRPRSQVELDRVVEHFAARCRAVVQVPWDGHLEAGAESALERLREPTRHAYLQLAAAVADGFASDPSLERSR